MKYSRLITILFLLLVVACESSTIYEKPENLLSEDQMVDLLMDLQIARYAHGKKNTHKDTKLDYTYLVYEKYGIDSARYAESNAYYASRIDEYKRIYSRVETGLKLKKVYYDSIKNVQDSINRIKIKANQPIKSRELKTPRD